MTRNQVTEEELPSLMSRFISKTDRDSCWIWLGSKDHAGYGQWTRGGRAHRKMYELIRGRIPEGLELDHLCYTPACVNPKHLEPVTREVNLARRRRKTHCGNGHEYTAENTYYRPNGHRKCKQCNRERWHK